MIPHNDIDHIMKSRTGHNEFGEDIRLDSVDHELFLEQFSTAWARSTENIEPEGVLSQTPCPTIRKRVDRRNKHQNFKTNPLTMVKMEKILI